MSNHLSLLTVTNLPTRDTIANAVMRLWQESGSTPTLFRTFGKNESISELGAAEFGATYPQVLADREAALAQIADKYHQVPAKDILSVGSNYSLVFGWDEFGFNAEVAANCGSAVLLILSRKHGCPCKTSRAAAATIRAHHATLAGVLVVDAPNPNATGTHLRGELDLGVPVAAIGSTEEVSVDELANQIKAAFGAQWEQVLGAQVDPQVVTPLQFQMNLVRRARQDVKTIVLPEPDDDRILYATDQLLSLGVANIVLIGDETQVRARAQELQLDIAKARIVSPHEPELVEKYATELAKLREKKGMTLEQAREKVQDVSFFGTMMVYFGDADGMVSGAAHTTAHTILPSFQTIKTKPGTSIVSSVFLMLMPDRVHVYGDCAVNPNPTPEQLAEIAISSAQTAKAFGVDPKIAMISYSTGDSGSGPDVDAVKEATRLLREKAPELVVDGPLQFDAAYDPKTGAAKMPGSAVAGQANVYIFPSLSVGNALYKAVQRTSGAVAVGPVLQGLKKPVNDLSRGALVEDIVNTVAITAVQAQEN